MIKIIWIKIRYKIENITLWNLKIYRLNCNKIKIIKYKIDITCYLSFLLLNLAIKLTNLSQQFLRFFIIKFFVIYLKALDFFYSN